VNQDSRPIGNRACDARDAQIAFWIQALLKRYLPILLGSVSPKTETFDVFFHIIFLFFFMPGLLTKSVYVDRSRTHQTSG
jgi:hypothetical protein